MRYTVTAISQQTRRPGFSLFGALRAVGRLVLPVLVLTFIFVLAYFTHDIPVSEAALPVLSLFDGLPASAYHFDPRWWPLTWAYLVMPLSFFAVHLTNRAHGADYALAQVTVTGGLLAGLVIWALQVLGPAFTSSPLPPRMTTIGFIAGMALGQLAAIFFFDRTRGTCWWTAPFYGSFFGGLVYVSLFHGLSRGWIGEPWLGRLAFDGALHIVAAIVLLIPYFLLRRLIRPRPGYGGA